MAKKTGVSQKKAKKTRASASSARSGRRKAQKRELIAPRNDKRYVRRDSSGRFDEVEDVGRSLAQDRRRTAKKTAGKGQGDRGDRARTTKSK
jgi:hypothetical protein